MTTATKSIVVDYDLPQSPALVWRALTEPKLLEEWLMRNDIAPVVGHTFNFHTSPKGNWEAHELDTIVTWTLTPNGTGTLLRLNHDGFRDEDQFAFEDMGKGWRGPVHEWLFEELAKL